MKKYVYLWLIVFGVQFNVVSQQAKDLNLMPWPQKVAIENSKFVISSDFSIELNNNSERTTLATTRFLRRLSRRTGVFLNNGFALSKNSNTTSSLEITFDRIGKLEPNEDESYRLEIQNDKISISATTDIGVVHGLETLLQLINNTESFYYFEGVKIVDFPRFTWRGLMLDVARHFQPIAVLKRNLDAMAAVKMNVFHWHLTDDQGFRIESKTHPKLHELGSDGLYYTQEQINEIVKYASDRGIRVIPEIDVPGHATAILTAYPEIASKDGIYEIERYSGIFNPTLDPTNERTYNILADVFGELAQLFPDKFVHIGGDENEGKHWDENKNIQKFKKNNDLKTNHDLQTYFNIRLEEILAKHGKSVMGWEEIMTDRMPTSALIHSWKGVNEGVKAGSSLITAAKKGYQTILSNGYYIDLMQPVSEHYLVDPMPKNNALTDVEKKRILGGEATMWSELATPLNIDSRLWPRTAAIAERFWSAREINNVESMYRRLGVISFRLEELGVTHIRNRDVILRNMTNNQAIHSLVVLSEISEPLKIYSRNKGGTEYKSYSPFALFADACTVDAVDAYGFKKSVRNYLELNNEQHKKDLLVYFDKWIVGYEDFRNLKKNPVLHNINAFYQNLTSVSTIYKKSIETKEISKQEAIDLERLLVALNDSKIDVELATYKEFKDLAAILIKKYSSEKVANKRLVNH
jgi:hexosaminidase